MPYQDTKVYYDGSHYIAIPKRPAPRHPGARLPEDLVEVVDESQDEPMEEQKEPKEVKEQQEEPPRKRQKSPPGSDEPHGGSCSTSCIKSS